MEFAVRGSSWTGIGLLNLLARSSSSFARKMEKEKASTSLLACSSSAVRSATRSSDRREPLAMPFHSAGSAQHLIEGVNQNH